MRHPRFCAAVLFHIPSFNHSMVSTHTHMHTHTLSLSLSLNSTYCLRNQSSRSLAATLECKRYRFPPSSPRTKSWIDVSTVPHTHCPFAPLQSTHTTPKSVVSVYACISSVMSRTTYSELGCHKYTMALRGVPSGA
jgi:hypothetical protein